MSNSLEYNSIAPGTSDISGKGSGAGSTTLPLEAEKEAAEWLEPREHSNHDKKINRR